MPRGASTRSSAPRSPGPASSTSGSRRRWFGEALAEILEAGADFGGGSAERPRAHPGRDGLGEPDRADHGRLGAERRVSATRSHACSPSPATRSSASTTTTTPARRWTRFRESVEAVRRGEEPPEDGYRGDYVAELARRRRPGAGDARARSRRRSSASGSTSTPGRGRASSSSELPECLPAARHVREGRRALGPRRRAYGDDQDRVLVRSPRTGGTPTYRAADVVYLVDKLERGFDRAIYVLGADHHGTAQLVRGRRAHARLRPGARRGAALPARPPHARRRADEDVEAARRRRLPRRVHGRGRRRRRALVPRQPRPRPDDRDRRRPGRRAHARRTRSTTSSTRTPGSPGSCATPATRRSSAEPPPRPAREERDLIKRLADFPAVAAEAAERRGPQAIPTYAIRVADDFHRFYHHHRVLESDAQAFRLGLVRGDADGDRPCLDLVGVEAPERM